MKRQAIKLPHGTFNNLSTEDALNLSRAATLLTSMGFPIKYGSSDRYVECTTAEQFANLMVELHDPPLLPPQPLAFNLARVVAEDVENVAYRLVLLVGLDRHFHLVDGEWMGYYTSPQQRSPFVLTRSRLEYSGDVEQHNFTAHPLKPGELFTITRLGETYGATYRLRSVTLYPSSLVQP